ncbi:MAG: PSD1 and planctomycete cytochrome C domain-containing protein [Planctomycetaceae bacterium]
MSMKLHIAATMVLLLHSAQLPGDEHYEKTVKPILQSRCFACHGALKQEAGLRLDTAAAMLVGGDSGAVIVAGRAMDSLLLKRVSSKEDGERMPPEGEHLKPEQIEAIQKWITSGAKAPENETPEEDPRDHWAFRAPIRSSVPMSIEGEKWNRNPIDAFLSAARASRGLVAQPEADRLTWLRRVTIDLTGLPPSPSEQTEFLNDVSPTACEKVVDRLLASPQYGERWGRHWMDIWRYSDWWGLGAEVRNSQKHIWHWRDWIIESLNEDKGYDQMLVEMLAADELYPNDLDRLRASGFLARQYFKFNRTSWLDETIQHTSKAMLGMTFNCGKCHDHKYDPLSQQEYYQLRAIFEPYQVRTDFVGEVLDPEQDGIPRAFDCNLDAQTWIHVRGDDRNPDLSKPITPAVPAFLNFAEFQVEPVALPAEAFEPGLREHVVAAHLKAAESKIVAAKNQLEEARKKLDEARHEAPNEEKPMLAETIAEDNFAQERKDLWKTSTGQWSWKDGHLLQSQVGATDATAILQKDVPQDFEVTLVYVPRGGDMWKSVGVRFDVPDSPQGTATDNVTVYLSSYAGGPKVQLSWNQNGRQEYPGDAQQARKVPLNELQTLNVRVRGTLINVTVNGEFAIAKRLPFDRKRGRLELMAFDAIAEFHSIKVITLPGSVALQEDAKGGSNTKLTPEVAQLLMEAAEKDLQRAELEPALIRARAAAKRAEIESPDSETTKNLIADVSAAELDAAVISAEATLANARSTQAQAIDAKKDEAAKAVVAAEEGLKNATENRAAAPRQYSSLPGALKTLENNLENEESRRKPFPRTSTGRRTAFARWMTDHRNPLTARVAVNHIWARHFGRGLVSTVFDFGRKGAAPSHPELLDWLAVDLMEHNWSMKRLHRMIVLSQTYRMTSSSLDADPATFAADGDNRFLWRMNPLRMEAQVVRDSLLSIAGELDLTMGGPSIPVGDDQSKRRSLYYFHSHNEHQKFLSMFDDASVLECYRRADSIVPQQALAMENSGLVSSLAGRIADRVAEEVKGQGDEAFVRECFRRILGTDASPEELTLCLENMTELRAVSGSDDTKIHHAIVLALLNHNDFITVR